MVLLVLALLVLAPLAPRALVSRPMLRPVSRPRLRAPQWAPQWAPLLIRSSCGVRARCARHLVIVARWRVIRDVSPALEIYRFLVNLFLEIQHESESQVRAVRLISVLS